MKKRILFDMDGTVADLYGVPNWLEKLRAEDPTPYLDANPMWDMMELADTLIDLRARGGDVVVVSWLGMDSTPSYKTATRRAKKEWLANYGFGYDEIHLVQYGTNKAKFRDDECLNILIDDNMDVRQKFERYENCIAVDPTTVDLIEFLRGL